MEFILYIFIGLTVLALLALATWRGAQDSRPFFDERPEGERFGTLRW